MKNVVIVFAILFVTVFAGAAMALQSPVSGIHETKTAFFAAPCPSGQEVTWCVAIKDKTSSEPKWEYRLSTRDAFDDEPFGLVRVLKTQIETITMIAPKECDLSRGAILAAYNGQPINDTTYKLDWFQVYTTTRVLTATRTGSKIVFSIVNEETRNELSRLYIEMLLIMLASAFAAMVLFRNSEFLLTVMAVVVALFTFFVGLNSDSWIQACVPIIVFILGAVSGEMVVRRRLKTKQKSADNPSPPNSGQAHS